MVSYEVDDMELNFLLVKVYDKDSTSKDCLLCWNAVRVECLQSGIRVLELKDLELKPTVSSLLVNIEFSRQ